MTAVGVAAWSAERQWGLLNWLDYPGWLELLLAVFALDLVIYLQHVAFHHVPLLWRIHKVHHADLEMDVTTGLRFHTLEILLSTILKIAAVLCLGPSVVAVVVFEVLLNGTSMFNHSNVRLPQWLDARLRLGLVTPDMHRVHHSVIRAETNSNYGFNLPWWDYLFRTYQAEPRLGHLEMQIGVEDIRDPRHADRLPQMLLMPWRKPSA